MTTISTRLVRAHQFSFSRSLHTITNYPKSLFPPHQPSRGTMFAHTPASANPNRPPPLANLLGIDLPPGIDPEPNIPEPTPSPDFPTPPVPPPPMPEVPVAPYNPEVPVPPPSHEPGWVPPEIDPPRGPPPLNPEVPVPPPTPEPGLTPPELDPPRGPPEVPPPSAPEEIPFIPPRIVEF